MLATPVETGRKDARIVQYQAIAGLQVAGKVAEQAVLPHASGAIQHQHARSGAILQRLLGDQLRRQVIVELAQMHFFRLKERAHSRDRIFV